MIAYSFHPDAYAEFEEAALFYESRMRGLGRSFAAEIERTVFHTLGCRRVVVASFSFGVYRQLQEVILVIAVAHQRRKPGYWRRRA